MLTTAELLRAAEALTAKGVNGQLARQQAQFGHMPSEEDELELHLSTSIESG